MEFRIYSVPFCNLENGHLEVLEAIYHQVAYKKPDKSSQGHLYDKVVYRKLCDTKKEIGRVYFAELGDVPIGFLLSFDTFNSKIDGKKYPDRILPSLLHHEVSFIEDLLEIGSFAFLDQFAILPEFRNKGYFSKLIAQFEKDAKKSGVLAIGTSIYDQNRRALAILGESGYRQIDYYASQKDRWCYRLVKILETKDYYKILRCPTSVNHFSTSIPIQLNRITEKLSPFLKQNATKLISSTFFHFNNQALSNVYRLKNHYHSHYHSLLDANREDNEAVQIAYRNIIQYLDQKDAPTKSAEKVASVSSTVLKKRLEIFLLNDDPIEYKFHSFDNALPLNIETLSARTILQKFGLNPVLIILSYGIIGLICIEHCI